MHRLERSVEYVTNKDKTVRPRPDSASSLQEAVDYTRNREKTECDVFESAIGCTLETAFEDMLANKKRWNQIDGVQGYHLVQSFAEGELTPELAHRIGLELAEKLLCGKYPAVIATHLNTRCLHNHIVWDSVAMDTGRKYRSNARSYYTEVRALSDRLCRQHGLSVINTDKAAGFSMNYGEWMAESRGQPTWRTVIRQDVDEAIASALTWRQFVRAMLNQAATDREELAKLLNISENQLSYITNVPAGHGLIRCGGAIIPFENSFPKNTKLYQLMTTKPNEKFE